jgi:S-adenosylmethionine/arginine decarboxylase-like enzyme
MRFLLVALSATFPDALGSIHPPLYPLERLGTHIILEVIDAPFALLNSSTKQLAALQAAAIAGGLTIVGQLVHQFPIMGASTILLISESHLSIHVWPCSAAAMPTTRACTLRKRRRVDVRERRASGQRS